MNKQSKTEVSAGGLIVFTDNKKTLILLMKDRGGNWTFPKGKIEKGEQPEETASREIEEEVGVKDLSVLAALPVSQYWYYRDGAVKKTVHYFLFRAAKKTSPVVQTEEGISEALWVPITKAKTMLGYPKTNLPLLEAAKAFL